MRFFVFFILSFFYFTPLFAQNLSTNPWIQKNTEQQIKKAYKKRDNRLSNSTSKPQKMLENSFFEEDVLPDISNSPLSPQSRKTTPSQISLKKTFSSPATTTQAPPPSPSKGFSHPLIKTPTFSYSKINSNSFLNKTKQLIKNTFNQIKKQIN